MTKIIEKIIVDISNIASYNKRNEKPKLSYIDLLFSTIPKEIELVGIADCSLYHQIDEKERYKKEYLMPKLIFEAPAGISADSFILTYALTNEVLILSNDRFKQYNFVTTHWLKAHRIKFMIINEQLIFQRPMELIFKNFQCFSNETVEQNKTKIREQIEV